MSDGVQTDYRSSSSSSSSQSNPSTSSGGSAGTSSSSQTGITSLSGASQSQREGAWQAFQNAGIQGSKLQGVWDKSYQSLDPNDKYDPKLSLSDDELKKIHSIVGNLVNTGNANGGSGSGGSSSGGSASSGGSSQGTQAIGNLSQASDAQRSAAYKQLQDAGLSGEKLQKTWESGYKQLNGANLDNAGLSDDEKNKARGVFNALGAGGTNGGQNNGQSSSGSSGTAGVSSASSSSSGSSGSSTAGATGSSGLTDAIKNAGASVGHAPYVVSDPSSLQQNKAAMVSALQAKGASDTEINQVMSMAMVETEHLKISERQNQSWKNGTDAQTYGAMNLNKALLKTLGATDSDMNSLNSGSDKDSIAKSAGYALDGLRKYGMDQYKTLVRGGTSGVGSDKQGQYDSALAHTEKVFEASKDMRTNAVRYGEHVDET